MCGPARLTYAELDVLVNRIAGTLREHSVGPEDLVAICVPRGPEMVAAMLAVLTAGAAYLPIDPAYPADRIRHLLADGRPVLLLTADAVAETLPLTDGTPHVVLPSLAPVAT